jgi:DNA replication protein DnaC
MREIFKRAAGDHDTVEVGAARWPVPKSVAHLCTPEATLSTLHGLLLGEDICACGHPVEASSLCSACRRPYQTPCCSDNCEEWVQPEPKSGAGWYPPPSQCKTCTAKAERALRESRLSYVPRKLLEGAAEYERRTDREPVDRTLHSWINADLNDSVWVSGARKSGKSTAVARAVTKLVMNERVKRVMWLEYEDFVTAAKRCYLDDNANQWKIIDMSMHAELLVLDDVFPMVRKTPKGKILGVERLSAHVTQTLSDLLRKRLHNGRPTLFTSVHTAEQALGHMGEHVYSWWQGDGIDACIEEQA